MLPIYQMIYNRLRDDYKLLRDTAGTDVNDAYWMGILSQEALQHSIDVMQAHSLEYDEKIGWAHTFLDLHKLCHKAVLEDDQ